VFLYVPLHLIYLFIFYIPWIIWGKPHLDTGIVNISRNTLYNMFIHLVVCLTTDPKPLLKPALHIVRSRPSSFKWEYPLLSLRSSSSFLHLLPCLPVTSIPPCIFPSVTRCRRQFRRKMWPIQFAFLLRISCRMFPVMCSQNYWDPQYKIYSIGWHGVRDLCTPDYVVGLR